MRDTVQLLSWSLCVLLTCTKGSVKFVTLYGIGHGDFKFLVFLGNCKWGTVFCNVTWNLACFRAILVLWHCSYIMVCELPPLHQHVGVSWIFIFDVLDNGCAHNSGAWIWLTKHFWRRALALLKSPWFAHAHHLRRMREEDDEVECWQLPRLDDRDYCKSHLVNGTSLICTLFELEW